MRYKSGIFDKLQVLYEETKFNDHQLHCVIRFEEHLDAVVMEKAMMLLLKAIPILSSKYVCRNGEDYWESIDPSQWNDIFVVVDNEEDFNRFIPSKTNEATGPQIKACLLKSDKDAMALILNHMVCDAAGFKQCLYLLSKLYSHLMDDPCYCPDISINGDRSEKIISKKFNFTQKIKAILFEKGESNQRSNDKFPMSIEKNIEPFILTHEILPERYAAIREYCKKIHVTVNDIVLAAYHRVMSDMLKLNGKELNIPIMVDMRRYVKDKSFNALSNLSSTVITQIAVEPGESFQDTVLKVNKEMNQKKAKNIGLNGLCKLTFIYKIFGNRVGNIIIRKALKNPYIFMTNIGVLDSQKLRFSGSPISNAFMCGSVKYRPHFQIALSSFSDRLTFSSNLYGSKEDRDNIENFFSLFDKELPKPGLD